MLNIKYFAVLCTNYYLRNLSSERANSRAMNEIITSKSLISLIVNLTFLKVVQNI